MEMGSTHSLAGAVTRRRVSPIPRALAPSGYLTSGPATAFAAFGATSSCVPTMRTQAIKATKPAAWQFADVRNHRIRRLWNPSQ